MIEEDYVSFETAKVLKEKGFDEACHAYYHEDNKKLIESYSAHAIKNISNPCFFGNAAPTLQMVMKWLREVHNIFICITPYEVGAGVMDYTYTLYKIDAKNFYFENLGIQGRTENINEISYEKTVESAIKYCLENLIGEYENI